MAKGSNDNKEQMEKEKNIRSTQRSTEKRRMTKRWQDSQKQIQRNECNKDRANDKKRKWQKDRVTIKINYKNVKNKKRRTNDKNSELKWASDKSE